MDKPLNVEQSRTLAKQISSKSSAPFDNAYRAALHLGGDVLYVQGFVALPGEPFQPIEHGWLELADCLVDPNFAFLKKPPEDVAYFPAQKVTLKTLKAAIEEAQEDYPEDEPLPIYGNMPYEYYGDLMLGGKEYQSAYEAASAKVREFNRPKPVKKQES